MGQRVQVVLQSRLSSSRLPGKAMLSIAGRPMVVLAAQRAGNAGHPVLVATSDQPEDDVIAAACSTAGVPVVRGPLDDPLARFVVAAQGLGDDDVVVRLTADNVVPDGDVVAQLVSALARRIDDGGRYARLGGDDPALPYGVAAEAFTVGVLRAAAAAATSPVEREHVTPWIRGSEGDHRTSLTGVAEGWAGLRCTVDTFDDFVAVARVLGSVEDPVGTDWREICELVRRSSGLGPAMAVRRANPIGQSALVLGTVQLGVEYGAANRGGMPDETAAASVLSAARRNRITHLDTARAYGRSEDRVGKALRRGLSEHVGVVTKVEPLTGDAGPADVRASVAESLRALGVDTVAGLLVHRAADWHRPGVAELLASYSSEGVAGVVGASLSTPEELLSLLADPRCGYVQLPFNLLDRRWLAPEVQAALAARPEVVVTVRSAYLQGLLAAGTDARWPSIAGVDGAAITASLDRAVAELGRSSRADLCIGYVLGHAWVTSVVAGAEAAAQVDDTAALVQRPPLTPDEVVRVHELVLPGVPALVDPSQWS